LEKRAKRVSICPADVFSFSAWAMLAYGATPHKELAWLSLLKEIAPL